MDMEMVGAWVCCEFANVHVAIQRPNKATLLE